MRISDWSSDVCSSDLWQWSHVLHDSGTTGATAVAIIAGLLLPVSAYFVHEWGHLSGALASGSRVHFPRNAAAVFLFRFDVDQNDRRSEEHTSELQSLMRISYAVFCLKKKKKIISIEEQQKNIDIQTHLK